MTTPTATPTNTPPPVAEVAFEKGGSEDAVTIQQDALAAREAAPETIGGQQFSSADIENARKQEKDKLYGRLDKQQEQIDSFQQMADLQRQEKEEAQAAAEEARKQKELDEMSAVDRMKAVEDDLKSQLSQFRSEADERLNALQSELAAKDALIERERQYQEVVSHKNRLLQEYSDRILPELVDLVVGNTKEDVEASISSLVGRSDAIMSNSQAALQPQRVRGVPATGGSTTGPLEMQTEQQTFTSEQIDAMSMEDYGKIRDRLLKVARP